jgi:hypothetical protein
MLEAQVSAGWWIPAFFAGMTGEVAEMTGEVAGMTGGAAGMTLRGRMVVGVAFSYAPERTWHVLGVRRVLGMSLTDGVRPELARGGPVELPPIGRRRVSVCTLRPTPPGGVRVALSRDARAWARVDPGQCDPPLRDARSGGETSSQWRWGIGWGLCTLPASVPLVVSGHPQIVPG